jgi:hypothetical protein
MRRGHGWITGASALALAALTACAAQLPATGTGTAPPTAAGSATATGSATARTATARSGATRAASAAAAAGSSSWRARRVAPLSPQATNVVVNPGADVAYEMVASARGDGPFRLRRIAVASKRVRSGPLFPVSGLQLAGGYVWVSGTVVHGSTATGVAFYQVNPNTLRVVRSWHRGGPATGIGRVPVTDGPARTVWVGFDRTLWRLKTSTGVIVARARLRSGLSVSDAALDPARTHLYVSVAPRLGGAAMREYSASSGRLLASASGKPLQFSISGAALTAVPGRVWASYRTGMAGQTILLRQRGLRTVRFTGGRTLFDWFMTGSTAYGGGSVWVGTDNGDIGCVAPSTGRVRARSRLQPLVAGGELLGVSPARHQVLAFGQSGILAITAPASCWR